MNLSRPSLNFGYNFLEWSSAGMGIANTLNRSKKNEALVKYVVLCRVRKRRRSRPLCKILHSMTSSKASPARLANRSFLNCMMYPRQLSHAVCTFSFSFFFFSAEHSASWLSVLLFSYVGSTVATGAERELEEAVRFSTWCP
jgi:hypothetical protein